ncbi:MAG: undecaprenyl-diphosphate phosphatase, partial [Clostridia bacterium]|nr:undecaprenyl-diphosphate phosphatase [Clostridia bacterium]
VQGLTEFLPVSSSGHLSLLQRLLGFDLEGGSMTLVNVMLHVGTLISVCAVFWRDILALFKKPYRMLFMLAVATLPAGLVGLLFHSEIDALFAGESGLIFLAVCFFLTAVVLLSAEFAAKRRKRHADLNWGNTLAMGFAQALALFPGISRSGSTIAAGTFAGAKPEKLAKFSFLMSVPVILGGFILEVKGLIFPAQGAALAVGWNEAIGMLFGVAFAAASGYFAIRFMLGIIGKGNYKWFSFYLVLLSLTCFWLNGIMPL